MFLSFGFYMPKRSAKRNSDAYKPTAREFINTLLKNFCKERSITISYVVLYMHKENRVPEQCLRTLATMKDLMLINSHLPVNFWAETMNTAYYLHNCLPTKRDGHTIIPEEA